MSHSDEWLVFEAIKGWLVQTPAAPIEVVHRLLGHVRFPRLAKDRQVQLETDELAMQHTGLIAKAYREELHNEDTPRTRTRDQPGMALKFKQLVVGMQVQVMDDLDFVKAACKVSAPGAKGGKINWNPEMAKLIGKEFVVLSTSETYMSASLATDGKFGMKRNWQFPHQVLTRVRT